MINPKEYSIGNYITYLDEIYVINGITYEEKNPDKWRIHFTTLDRSLPNTKSISWVEGIPLTPVLLYGAGFSTPHDYVSTVVSKGGVMIDYHLGKFRLRDNSRITIDYLHQLQNLYFALTGEELTINHEHLQSTGRRPR